MDDWIIKWNYYEWMNEWMNEWIETGMHEWMNGWIQECMNEWMHSVLNLNNWMDKRV